jgi:3-oxoacyl-[acyl-carrier protein] reductase
MIRHVSNHETMEERMGKLSGKVAIVTGASKGIGAGIARALGGAGAAVVVNYAGSKEGAERVVAEIVAREGRAIAVQADVSKAADVERLFAETRKAFGPPHILVNNAGVYEFAPIEQLEEAAFQRMFGINVLGPLLTTKEAVRHFGPDGGSVINVSSVASFVRMPAASVYSATKSALDTITRVLALELGPKRIRVNAINPGPVETEGTHAAGLIGSDLLSHAVTQTPLGRIGQPEDIAQVALFLASPESGWLTGEVIAASGGFR